MHAPLQQIVRGVRKQAMRIYPEYISEAECVDLDIAVNVYADFSLVFTTPC